MNYFWAPVNINTLYCWVRILDTKIPLRLGWLPGRPHDWPFDHFHNWPYEHIFWRKKIFSESLLSGDDNDRDKDLQKNKYKNKDTHTDKDKYKIPPHVCYIFQ